MEAKRLCCCCCDDLMAAFSTKPIQANAWVLFCQGKEDTYHELCVHNMRGGCISSSSCFLFHPFAEAK
jgi:hypothetical protein